MLQLKEAEDFRVNAERVIDDLNHKNQLLSESYDSINKKLKNYKPQQSKKYGRADLNKTFNASYLNGTFIDKNQFHSKESDRQLPHIEEVPAKPRVVQE